MKQHQATSNYTKRYATYISGIGALIVVNVLLSVFSMYSGSEQKMVASELEQLRTDNIQLELTLTQLQQTAEIEKIAIQENFIDSQQLHHVVFPTSQTVAQR